MGDSSTILEAGKDVLRPTRRDMLTAAAAGAAALALPKGALGQGQFASVPPKYMLVDRITFGYTEEEAALFDTLGFRGYLEYHMNPSSIVDDYADKRMREFPMLPLSPKQALDYEFWEAGDDVILMTMMRNVSSKRQLLEVMTDFWSDHLNVFPFKHWVTAYSIQRYNQDVIRANALGKFPAMLKASCRHPAMLCYLDNDQNVAARRNENFGRELLELHSLTPAAGYDEGDVFDVAECFTGWNLEWDQASANWGTFKYVDAEHVQTRKRFMTLELPHNNGILDGETLIDFIAMHRSTAEHIATKLINRFLNYEAPEALVTKVADKYMSTGGDIKSMLRLILTEKNFKTYGAPKYKQPYHMIVSGLRVLDARVTNYYTLWWGYIDGPTRNLPFSWVPPNGFLDTYEKWVDNILPRWRFSSDVTQGFVGGVYVNLFNDLPGYEKPQVLDRINQRVFGGKLPASERTELTNFGVKAKFSKREVREVYSLAMSGPAFQWY